MTRTVRDPADLVVSLGGRSEGPDILLLHPAGGGVLPYLPLAQGLAAWGRVSALRACGLMPGEIPDTTIEDAVDRYEPLAADLRPEVLVGWSMGGILAWELAARLAARSVSPRAVVVIDSAVDPSGPLTDARTDELADLVQTHGLPGAGTGSAEERRTVRAHVRANALHRVEVHQPAPTLVLTCRDGSLVESQERWRRLAPATVTLGVIPGTHFEVFGADALPVLLDRIRAFLDSVDLAVVA